jgi:hypothetical protein
MRYLILVSVATLVCAALAAQADSRTAGSNAHSSVSKSLQNTKFDTALTGLWFTWFRYKVRQKKQLRFYFYFFLPKTPQPAIFSSEPPDAVSSSPMSNHSVFCKRMISTRHSGLAQILLQTSAALGMSSRQLSCPPKDEFLMRPFFTCQCWRP